MKPSIDPEELAKKLSNRPVGAVYPEEIELIAEGKCPKCEKRIRHFDDRTSVLEYRISGLCQDCQNELFK